MCIAGTISAAFAGASPDAGVITSDPLDLHALAEHTAEPISIVGVLKQQP